MSVTFEDYSVKVKNELNDQTIKWLFEAGGELQAKTQRNTRVDTGQLKGSWTYNVDESKGECQVGSPLENAIWEEFGTGIYAVNGDGRKTPWVYEDRKGEKHFTHGKHPNRTLFGAYTSIESKLKQALEKILKGMG